MRQTSTVTAVNVEPEDQHVRTLRLSRIALALALSLATAGGLAETGDRQSLAEAMSTIARSPQRADGMIERGRRLSEELANDVVCGTWTTLFESVIPDGAHPRSGGAGVSER